MRNVRAPSSAARRSSPETRGAWGGRWLDALGRDARLAVRMLARSPGYTATTVLSLALAFVVVASTSAVMNAYLVRGLPYPASDRLFNVMYAPPGPWEPRGVAALDWGTVGDAVEYPITAAGDTLYLGDGGYAQAARVLRVDPGFVEGLGVRAHIGRSLDPRDWQPGSDAVAMIGYGLWRDRYAGDPGVIGRIVRGEHEAARGETASFRVVGVLPRGFYFGRDSSAVVDVLTPLAERRQTYMVRLRPGVPAGVAEARLTAAARKVATDLPSDWTGVHLESARERYVGSLRPVLLGATAAAGLILSLVWTNVVVLTLLRTMRRGREMAIRVALGSGRLALARMLGIEAALLAATSVVSGLALSGLALRLLGPAIERRLGRPAPGGEGALSMDATALLIVATAGVLISLSLALLPLLTTWQRQLGTILSRTRSSSTSGVLARRLRSGLLAAEVAGALVLLVGGGLLVRSTVSMLDADLGFAPGQAVRSRVALRGAGYADGPAFSRFYEQFRDLAAARLGAKVVFSTWPPFAEFPAVSAETEATAGAGVQAGSVDVGAGYFDALGITLREGRDVSLEDERTGAKVAVVSETLARRLWPNGGALGERVRRVEQTPRGITAGPWLTVVGVVADVRQSYFDRRVGDLYAPLSPDTRGRFGSLFVRTGQSPIAVWAVLRDVAAGIDRTAIVSEPRTLDAENLELESTRFVALTLAAVAIAAALLAVLGIYAVTSFTVNERSRELAVRSALGATPARIRRLLLSDVGRVLLTGLAVGLTGALMIGHVVEAYLYGVPARDVPTIAAASLLLAAIGLTAAWRPVGRAAQESPVRALKAD